MNGKNIRIFTETLYELVNNKNLGLHESLKLISETDFKECNNVVKNAACEIINHISDGYSFSAALNECKSIQFDSSYVNFFSYSELSGNIKDTIQFLRKRCNEKYENLCCLISASVYPAFVFLVGIVMGGIVLFYGRKTFSSFGFYNAPINHISFFRDFFLFLCFCVFCFNLIFKNLREDKKYEAFLVVSFLLKAGMNISGALSYAVLILGEKSREGKMFIQARERLSFGMDLKSSFMNDENKKINIPGFEASIIFAQKGGSKSEVFEKIAVSIRDKDIKKRKVCLGLLEPLLISLTGIFLLMLVMNFIMPVVMSTGIIL